MASPSALVDRVAGIVLFLPVPLVLWLFTRAPLGVAASLVAGLAVMVLHRVVARPAALARASRRCLWCGGEARPGHPVVVADPAGTVAWQACSASHRARLVATLGWVAGRRRFVAAGIGGAIVTFLPLAWLADARRLGPLGYADAVAWFKALVAVTVLPIGWMAPRDGLAGRPAVPGNAAAPRDELRLPFPAHIQALVGTAAAIWLFRIVGAVWLGQALLHLATRLFPS
jgi:hypothetical protein